MKLMKTKLGLSVLALALVGAGAWSLQSPVTASAEVDMSGFKMENGASVCLSGVDVNEKEFNGIRWTTTVEPEFYTSAGANLGSEFGVIVAPTKLFTGELTFDTTLTNGSQVKKLPVKGIDASSEAKKYYSVIDYSELGDPSEAYKLELTARAYVDVDGDLTTTEDCYYADMTGINTSRSARQVAVSAELAGVVEENDMAKAREYYGEDENVTKKDGFVESTGAVGTQYIDMEKSTANLSITLDGSVIEDVLVGSEVMADYSYDNGTLTLNDLSGISCGEQYLTVFTENGLFVEPIIGATKVLTEASDLAIFKAKGTNSTSSTKVTDNGDGTYSVGSGWTADQEQGGYYVLGNNIDGQGTYKHGTGNSSSWSSISKYEGLPIGLTGTFNGLGYEVKGIVLGQYDATDSDNTKKLGSYEGFFGIINGGTLKNIAFKDLENAPYAHGYGLAYAFYNATIENVLMDVTMEGMSMHKSAVVANTILNTTMTNCVIKLTDDPNVDNRIDTTANKSGSNQASFFNGSATGSTFKGVYVVSPIALCIEFGGNYMYAENETTESFAAEFSEHILYNADGKGTQVGGVKRYKDALPTTGEYTALENSGCWSLVENLPVWKSTQQSN